MTKGREESDDRIGSEGGRKVAQTASSTRGEKAVTARNGAVQLGLFRETADSPKGDDGGADMGRPVPAARAVPKSRSEKGRAPPAMTMEAVSAISNLKRAFERVARNDGAPGPDRQSVEAVSKELHDILPWLSRELCAARYLPGMVRRVWIEKAGGGERGLGIPNVIDRIVQQAMYQVLSPHYEPSFHASSHGFRPGKSCHTAIAQAREYLEDGYEWVVDIDLEKFFDRVHHDRLMARLAQRIEDVRVLKLIRKMLTAKVVMPNGLVEAVEEGTPQGGPISPLLSNIVLDELDQELARRGYRFVRYADDCNIYVRSERSGRRVMESVTRFLERRLRLHVNVTKSAVAKPEERHFLGFRLRRNPQDGSSEVLLSRRSKARLDERLRALTPRTWGKTFDSCLHEIKRYVDGWLSHFWVCTHAVKTTLAGIDAHLRRRLRALLLRHWRRKPTMVRRLVRLGVKKATARKAIYQGRRAWWDLSHAPAVERGLSNAYLAKRGLTSIAERWHQLHDQRVNAPVQLTLTLG
jgi:RNA-directed DNA polymerase